MIRKTPTALAVGGTLFVSAASFAATMSPADCVLRHYHVTSVTPYHSERQVCQAGAIRDLVGASVYVHAEPGLTTEWLRLNLDHHRAEKGATAAMKDCPFGVDGVQLDVESSGAGFYVTFLAPNATKAEEALRRTRLLLV